VFALLSNLREFRAEIPVVILILPAALGTLVRTIPHPLEKSQVHARATDAIRDVRQSPSRERLLTSRRAL